jgi:hypothetical protein
MRPSAQKMGRRLCLGLAVLVAICGLVKAADYAWFRTQVPIHLTNANWEGTWTTNRYGLTGRLLVRLPDPLPVKQDFKADALVYYPIYSGWKAAQFVKMDFTGYFAPNSPTTAGQSTNPLPNGGGKLKFKGVVDKDRAESQVVEYSALIDPNHTRIVGAYLSKSPDDYGTFEIRD